MEKEKSKKGKGHIVIVTLLVVLLLMAFLGIGFAIGITKAADLVTKEANQDQTKVENISIYDEQVVNALKGFEQIGIDPEDLYGFKAADLNKKQLVITALKGLKKEQINYCASMETLTNKVTIEELNILLKNSVENKTITLDDVMSNEDGESSYSVGGYAYGFKYPNGTKEQYSIIIKGTDMYVVGPCGHEGPNTTDLATQSERAEIVGNYLYVYQRVAFGKTEFVEGKGFVTDYYTEKGYNNKIETIDGATADKNPTWEKYKSYKLIFKRNNEKYYFIESVLEQ